MVVAIIGVFFSLTISGARPNANSQIRRAAQELASVLNAVQSRALGKANGAAVILEVATTPTGRVLSGTISHAALPPLITGTTTTATLPLSGTQVRVVAPIELVPLNADPEELEAGYKIQLGGDPVTNLIPWQPPSPWFTLVTGAPQAKTLANMVYRGSDGQTASNTIWPEPTIGSSGTNPFTFRVACYPLKSDVALTFPKAAAIDLRYSGIGEDNATIWNPASWMASGTAVAGWGNLGGKGSLGIVFDCVGGVESLMQQVDGNKILRQAHPPIDPGEPIYLLVNARDVIEDATKPPLANAQAMWVVIHPQNGRVSLANNVPQANLVVDRLTLRAARERARSGVIGSK